MDVGCGPGLLPALFAQYGCHAFGVDLDLEMLHPNGLHPHCAQAEATRLPFGEASFQLVTASNLLFLLPDAQAALKEMRRLLRPDGWLCLINPSERMSLRAAEALADARGLEGLSRRSLLNWARTAESNQRWSEAEMGELFSAAGLELVESALRMGPGLARFVRGRIRKG